MRHLVSRFADSTVRLNTRAGLTAIQARVLPGLADKLRFNGKRISWEDVWQENYLVSVHADGSVAVRELGRCFYCKKIKEND